jgi:DNA-binding NtrC family response regulator
MPRILILEDDIEMVHALSDIMQEQGYETAFVTQSSEAMAKVESFQPHLVTLDLEYVDGGSHQGLEILKEIRTRFNARELPVIAVSGTGNASKMTELLKMGLNDYVFKPLTEPEQLVDKIKHFLSLSTAVQRPKASGSEEPSVVGTSRVIMELILKIQQAASQELDVLFLGETGVGKNYFAEIYRQFCPNRQHLFTVDLPTVTKDLFQSEMYGYEKGSHNKASEMKIGKVEAANGGILFLDEIGDLDFDQQAKISSLIQFRTISRLGSSRPIKLNLVILAATNRPLEEMVKARTFREDLFHRLGMQIKMPALREHSQDIPELVNYFVQRYQSRNQVVKNVSPEALQKLQTLPWPGNIRQLEKTIENGLANCRKETLGWKDFEGFLSISAAVAQEDIYSKDYTALKDYLQKLNDEIETRYLRHHLEQNHNNIPRTAEAINLPHRQQLNQWMRRLKIDCP